MNECSSIDELQKFNESVSKHCEDLLIKFVKKDCVNSYAELQITHYSFKCANLLDALNMAFMYIQAMKMPYPQLCLHVWQFVQLAIYNLDLPVINKSPFIETILNDLIIEEIS